MNKELCIKVGKWNNSKITVYLLGLLTFHSYCTIRELLETLGAAGRECRCYPKTCSYFLIKAMYWVAICHLVQKTNSTCLAARLLGDLHFYQPQARRLCSERDDLKISYFSDVIFPSSSLCLNAPSRSAAFGNTADTVAENKMRRAARKEIRWY